MKFDDFDCSNASQNESSEQPSSVGLRLSTDISVECNNHNSEEDILHGCQSPVLIVPNLYLGNAEDASDLKTLQKNGIKYILNVTPDLPNTFENDKNFKYMRIPADENWSQSLTKYFPGAFKFIGK